MFPYLFSIFNYIIFLFNTYRNSQKSKKWVKETHELIKKLDKIERIPLIWPLQGNIPSPIQNLLIVTAKHLEEGRSFIQTKKLLNQRTQLRRRYLALLFRLNLIHENPFYERHRSFRILEALATRWHQEHRIHYKENIPIKVYAQLKRAALYPYFVDLILEDLEFSNVFLDWVLQDHNSVEPFLEYPASQQLLSDCNLAGRLERAVPKALQIMTSGNQKYLALLIEGKYVNMLELQEKVTLRGDWTLSLGEIFEIFKEKNYGAENLEFFSSGICNWNAHKLGYWNHQEKKYHVINLDLPLWWNQLPILEVLDKSEARQRYGFAVDGKHWLTAATATRGSATLDYEHSHAYLEVAIPMRDGRYAIYDFGKFATIFPRNMIETLKLFANSVHATVAYPDENTYYTHRQRAQHAFVLTENEGQNLMQLIKRDILKGRRQNFVYQIESENCAKWVQTILQEVLGIERVPNMFIMPLIEAEPKGPMSHVFSFLRKMPYDLPSRLLVYIHVPLGAWRGTWIEEDGKKVWKALNVHPFWYSGLVYLPAFLHKQRTTGLLHVVQGGKAGSLLRSYEISPKEKQSFGAKLDLPFKNIKVDREFQSLNRGAKKFFVTQKLIALER